MNNLDLIYDKEFFRQWGRGNELYIRSAEAVAEALFDMFKPRALADLGCGCGVYSRFFAGKGVSVLSLDGVLPPPEHAFSVKTRLQDLTVPFENVYGDFDLALCLEVAEHIPEEFTDIFLKNVTAFSGLLAMSAAPPGQGGRHHVNERPRRYWAQKLAGLGFAYNRRASGRILEALNKARPPLMWMANHIGIYELAKSPGELKHGRPFAVKPPHADLAGIEPGYKK